MNFVVEIKYIKTKFLQADYTLCLWIVLFETFNLQ